MITARVVKVTALSERNMPQKAKRHFLEQNYNSAIIAQQVGVTRLGLRFRFR